MLPHEVVKGRELLWQFLEGDEQPGMTQTRYTIALIISAFSIGNTWDLPYFSAESYIFAGTGRSGGSEASRRRTSSGEYR
jgi:hypothetical protein